jgi:hypothetical protein
MNRNVSLHFFSLNKLNNSSTIFSEAKGVEQITENDLANITGQQDNQVHLSANFKNCIGNK